MRALLNDIKKTVVFLGTINEKGETVIRATGFLISINNVFHLVTAKHVVLDPRSGRPVDSGMQVLFNLKEGKVGQRPLDEIKKTFAVDWIFHPNSDVDVAIIPFGLDLERDDVKTIPENLFFSTDRLFELYDVFFLSYQPGVQSRNKISPIIRSGTVALINENKTFYIDGAAFPGNSGSPVFLKPSPIRFDKIGISIGGDPLGGKLIGIIGEYIPYREVAISTQTRRPRVVFEENTGLSKVWSITFVEEIVNSDVFNRQLQEFVAKNEKTG